MTRNVFTLAVCCCFFHSPQDDFWWWGMRNEEWGMRSEEWLCIRAGALFRDGPPPTDPRMLGRSPTSTTRPSLRYHSLTPSTLLFIFNPMIYMADSTADTSVHSRVRSIKVNLFIVFSFFSLHRGRQSLFLSFPLRQIRSTHASSWPLSFFIRILNISYDIVYIVRLVTTRFQFCWNCFGTSSVRLSSRIVLISFISLINIVSSVLLSHI